jgi:hypothetical protein
MSDANNPYQIGFGKPPKEKRFAKGKSGNPNGRPKGSQNLMTVLERACREKIHVTINGKARYISKFEATMLQLINRAVAGELRAISTLFTWITGLWNLGQSAVPDPILKESDSLIMASIVQRMRQSDPLSAAPDTSILTLDSSTEEPA